MRLLNTRTLTLEEYEHGREMPKYAILSHAWGLEGDELNYTDVEDGVVWAATSKPGYQKVVFAAEQASQDGLSHLWVDTCCIDKRNSTELSEAINSMFKWYSEATRAYVYLADVHHDSSAPSVEFNFGNSTWFKRGWTLQELLAPTSLKFFDASWQLLGTRSTLQDSIHAITGINRDTLSGLRPLTHASVAERMCWAANRVSKRPEDTAYSMLGIFDVHMPLLYGEGQAKAFQRLQEEIIKRSDDQSIFVWSLPSRYAAHGLLAPSPKAFEFSSHAVSRKTKAAFMPYTMTHHGLQINLPVAQTTRNGLAVATLSCIDQRNGSTLGIYLKRIGENQYVRTRLDQLPKVGMGAFARPRNTWTRQTIFIPQVPLSSCRMPGQFRSVPRKLPSGAAIRSSCLSGSMFSNMLWKLGCCAGCHKTMMMNTARPWRYPSS